MNQRLVAACLLIAALPASVAAEALSCTGARPDVKRAFFGDLHVHTSFSIDARALMDVFSALMQFMMRTSSSR